MDPKVRPVRQSAIRAGAAIGLVALLAASVALNVALLNGGEFHERTTGFLAERLGVTAHSRQQAEEIDALQTALASERSAKESAWSKISELDDMLLMSRESRRSIRERYVVLSDELQSMKSANEGLRSEITALREEQP